VQVKYVALCSQDRQTLGVDMTLQDLTGSIVATEQNGFHHVEYLDHDGRQTLADHIPVVTKIVLTEPVVTGLRKGTYLKYDASILDDAKVLAKVKEAWGTRRAEQDPMEFWNKGWRRIAPVMKAEKKHRQNRFSSLDIKRLELEELCKQVTGSSTEEDLSKLRKLETEVRETERKEAISWRQKSRVRWLALGEAPSKYFYAQLKAKHHRDTILELEDQGGNW
jgi:hypothetical protein